MHACNADGIICELKLDSIHIASMWIGLPYSADAPLVSKALFRVCEAALAILVDSKACFLTVLLLLNLRKTWPQGHLSFLTCTIVPQSGQPFSKEGIAIKLTNKRTVLTIRTSIRYNDTCLAQAHVSRHGQVQSSRLLALALASVAVSERKELI